MCGQNDDGAFSKSTCTYLQYCYVRISHYCNMGMERQKQDTHFIKLFIVDRVGGQIRPDDVIVRKEILTFHSRCTMIRRFIDCCGPFSMLPVCSQSVGTVLRNQQQPSCMHHKSGACPRGPVGS